jgi:hypothetical protein
LIPLLEKQYTVVADYLLKRKFTDVADYLLKRKFTDVADYLLKRKPLLLEKTFPHARPRRGVSRAPD